MCLPEKPTARKCGYGAASAGAVHTGKKSVIPLAEKIQRGTAMLWRRMRRRASESAQVRGSMAMCLKIAVKMKGSSSSVAQYSKLKCCKRRAKQITCAAKF